MEKISNLKKKLKTFFEKNKDSKYFGVFKRFYIDIRSKIINSYEKCKIGEEKLNTILVFWSLLPMLFYFLVRNRIIRYGFFATVLDLFFFSLFCLSYYFITKAVNVNPEYDVGKMEELKKIEYYNSLSDEEFKKIKKEENKASLGKFVKKYVLLRSDKKTEAFKLVKILLIMFMLLSFKRIIF